MAVNRLTLALLILGSSMFALWCLANLAYSVQGVCLLTSDSRDRNQCSTGYSSNSITKPIVSLEFLLIASAIEIAALSMLAYEKKAGARMSFS
jgi:hypothetical protein